MAEVDWFERGLKVGGAYQEGQDKESKRRREEREADDISSNRREVGRGLKMQHDETERVQKRARTIEGEVSQLYGGGGAAPTGDTVNGKASTVGADGAPAANAPAAPTTEVDDLAVKAKRSRGLAHIYGNHGEIDKATKYEAEAEAAELNSIFLSGAQQALTPELWDAARKNITINSKFVQIGKDAKGRNQLSVQQPNGETTYKELTAENQRAIMGGVALMKAGKYSAAYGKFAQVSADLAIAAKTENELRMKTAEQNSVMGHRDNQDETARMNAQANQTSAAAANKNADTQRLKQSFGQPVNLVDEKGNAKVVQPVMVNGKVQYDEVQLPPGTRFPTQKPEVELVMGKDGNGVAKNRDGILYKVVDGVPQPAEKDMFEGETGQKMQAEWENKGVVRQAGFLPNGKMTWGFVSADDPERKAWGSPQEAEMAGKKAKAKATAGQTGTAGGKFETGSNTGTF